MHVISSLFSVFDVSFVGFWQQSWVWVEETEYGFPKLFCPLIMIRIRHSGTVHLVMTPSAQNKWLLRSANGDRFFGIAVNKIN